MRQARISFSHTTALSWPRPDGDTRIAADVQKQGAFGTHRENHTAEHQPH